MLFLLCTFKIDINHSKLYMLLYTSSTELYRRQQ